MVQQVHTARINRADRVALKGAVHRGDFEVELYASQGKALVFNHEGESAHWVEMKGCVPQSGECKAARHHHGNGVCKHVLAVVSHLLYHPDELFRYLQRRNDGDVKIPVRVKRNYAEYDADIEIVGMVDTPAGENYVGSETLPEYWARKYGVEIDRDTAVATVTFDGNGEYSMPVSVLMLG